MSWAENLLHFMRRKRWATDKNNTNWGAAAFGGEVDITDNTTNTVDSFNPDQSDDDGLDLDVSDSGNDSSTETTTESNGNGNDSSLDLSASDILNDKSVNTDNSDNSNDDVNNTDNSLDLSASDFLNDKSINTDNSDNSDDDVITKTDSSTDDDIDDSFNSSDDDLALSFTDSSATDSYNDSSTDDDTTITDSGNFSLAVDIADSFNDNDLIDIDSLTSPLESIQALGGNGNVFDLDQILTMNDQDQVYDPSVSNNDCFDQYSEAVTGGTADASSAFGDANGDADVAANASASAGGAANLSAFNQDIALGANIQYASVDMSVVGGSDSAGLTGDDS